MTNLEGIFPFIPFRHLREGEIVWPQRGPYILVAPPPHVTSSSFLIIIGGRSTVSASAFVGENVNSRWCGNNFLSVLTTKGSGGRRMREVESARRHGGGRCECSNSSRQKNAGKCGMDNQTSRDNARMDGWKSLYGHLLQTTNFTYFVRPSVRISYFQFPYLPREAAITVFPLLTFLFPDLDPFPLPSCDPPAAAVAG